MKNPYGVEPTRYMKRDKSQCVIGYKTDNSLIFGNIKKPDIYIYNNYNEDNSCGLIIIVRKDMNATLNINLHYM